MKPISRESSAGAAYLALRSQALRTGRPTQELLQLYALEGFLARLAVSPIRQRLVLKGGVLLAAFDSRRPTKDIDFAARNLSNEADSVLTAVRSVLDTRLPEDDGLLFSPETARAEPIREEDHYSGVRVRLSARLASAHLPFHVDVNVGDPIWPQPMSVLIPRLRGGAPIELQGYPIHMVQAEKIVTAAQRGTANTRWRDFGGLWSLAQVHAVAADALARAISEVAAYRQTDLQPLEELLVGFADFAQVKWAAWRRRSSNDRLPETLDNVLASVIAFADPAISNSVTGRVWNPRAQAWLPPEPGRADRPARRSERATPGNTEATGGHL